MNPFSIDSEYDDELASILGSLNKKSVSDHLKSLKRLLEHIPSINIENNAIIIKRAIKPSFSHQNAQIRLISSQILLKMLEAVGKGYFSDIQAYWMYHNIENNDVCTREILKKYFKVSHVESELFGLLTWEDPIKDLGCFVYLINRSKEEYKFDPKIIKLDNLYVFDQFISILTTIKHRKGLNWIEDTNNFLKSKYSENNVSDCLKSLSLNDSSPFYSLYKSIFDHVLGSTSILCVNKKHEIILEFYSYLDPGIYKESSYLSIENLRKAIDLGLDYKRVKAETTDQFILLCDLSKDKHSFFKENLKSGMNVLKVLFNSNFDSDFIKQNLELILPIATQTITTQYEKMKFPKLNFENENSNKNIGHITALSSENEKILNKQQINRLFDTEIEGKEEKAIETLKMLEPFFNGWIKIVVAKLCGYILDPLEFEHSEIEKVYEFSIYVFPLEYFITNKFEKSCKIILEKYSSLLKEPNAIKGQQFNMESLMYLYPSTKLEEVVEFIQDIDILKKLILPLPEDESLKIYDTVSKSKIKYENYSKVMAVLHFKLRSKIAYNEIDFDILFENFLNKEYIIFLIKEKNTRLNLIYHICKYLKEVTIENSIYFTGYNFDDDEIFYTNLKDPIIDPCLRLFYEIYKDIKRTFEENILFYILSILNFESFIINEKEAISKYLDDCGFEFPISSKTLSENDSLFNLGSNNFLIERIYREAKGIETKLDFKTLSINRNKAVDVLARTFSISYLYLVDVNSTYLSLDALKRVIASIVSKNTVCSDKDFIDRILTPRSTADSLSFISLIERDDLLMMKDLRENRFVVYKSLIDRISNEASKLFVDNYSFSKLENNSDDRTVFDFIISPLVQCKRSFWPILTNTLHKTNNLYISLFVESFITNLILEIESAGSVFDISKILKINEYLYICTKDELNLFCFIFPTLFKRLKVPRKPDIDSIMKEIANTKINGAKLSLTNNDGQYNLRMIYNIDSSSNIALIHIPQGFPEKVPKIEFDHSSNKCTKFYMRLNELLRKTTKFIEILMMWKVSIDNRLEGHTECLICYFILEPKYKTLPEFSCPTCKNRFHKKCIFQWLSNSKNTLCPMCRVELPVWQ